MRKGQNKIITGRRNTERVGLDEAQECQSGQSPVKEGREARGRQRGVQEAMEDLLELGGIWSSSRSWQRSRFFSRRRKGVL
jgi:hypothetical protein